MLAPDETGASAGGRSASAALLEPPVAVGKTPREPAGSLVRAGSENDHLVRRTQPARRERTVHGGSEVHLRKRAAPFLGRLFPTASPRNSTPNLRVCCSSITVVSALRSAVSLSSGRSGPRLISGSSLGSPVCPRAPVDERIGDGVVAGGPLTHPGSGESPLSAGSRRPGRVLSQASTSAVGTTKPSQGRGSSCVSAKVRASCVAGRQSITSASIRCAKARAAGAGWPGKGCPSCLCGPVNVRACRPGTARVQSRPIGRRTAFRASEARHSGFGTGGSLPRMRAWVAS
jgi:hypothetical protein